MRKTEAEGMLAERLMVSRRQAELLLRTVLDVIETGLKTDGKVVLTRFGSFKVRDIAAHDVRNPRDGSRMTVAKHRRVSFKAGNALQKTIA